MTSALRPHIGVFCHIYIDDVIIWSDNLEEPQWHVHLVLEALRNTHIYLNPKKCHFFLTEVYLCTTLEDRSSDCLTVAKESSALRTILPLINHNQYVESVLDPGSQVIAMSEAMCHALALIYDPRIRLRMQSANREVDKTLGLAHNMLILVRDIMLYIQFHIVRNLAYDILLGRPFDILVESIVWNYSNEDQTITIHDLNSRRIAMVPTFPRGTPPQTTRPSPDFCDSRI